MDIHPNKISVSAGTFIKAILIGLLFYCLFLLKDLVLVVLMSIILASAIEPVAQVLIRRKIPRILAIILIYLSLAAILVGVVFLLFLPLLSESSQFLTNFPSYFNVENVSNTISQNQFLSSQSFVSGLQNTISFNQIIGQINNIITNLSSSTFGTISNIFGGILSFILMIVLSFYLSVEDDGIGAFLKMVSPLHHENYIINLWKRSQKKIGLWMQGQIILAVIIGMLVYLGLLLLNIQNALLLAFLAAAFKIIPLFGPILASIPAIGISFVTGGFTSAFLVAGLYIIVHQFENQLIYPLVVKKVVGVPPILSIVALIAGWQLAGFVGLIISVPLAAIIIEFFEDLERDKIEKIERSKSE